MIDCLKTEIFFKEKRRMCKMYDRCCNCPVDEARKRENTHNMWCSEFCEENPKKVIEIVQQWSDEHPRKTMLEDLLEKFPKAKKENVVENICPNICPNVLGYEDKSYCKDHCGDCAMCWNRPYEEDAE